MALNRLALLGFGNVGRAFTRLLKLKQEELHKRYQITFCVTGIATRRHGIAVNPAGLNLEQALACVEAGESIARLSSMPVSGSTQFINCCEADVLFENTPVDHMTGEPAVTHLRLALQGGMHAITANKGPVVHAYRQLMDLASEKRRRFLFESTVMDGAPVFSLFREALPAIRLESFCGILNSTTNLILTRMEQGEAFEQAVSYAQSIGIAETDPGADIDGWDAAIKVAALATVLMGVPLKPQDMSREGIRNITPEKISSARAAGKRWKLVGKARRAAGGVSACVAPELVGPESPMFTVDGTTSICTFETDVLGLFSVIETDPGPQTTAYGLLADFVNAVK